MSLFPVGFGREYTAGENAVKSCDWDPAACRGLVPSLSSCLQGLLV